MVTVEAAVAIGSLIAVLAVVLAAMAAMLLQMRCADAAAEAARLAVRGDADGARGSASRLVPDGAVIDVELRGDDVAVRVDAAPLGSALPSLRVGAHAAARREPDLVASGEPGTDTAAGSAGDASTGPDGAAGDGPPGTTPTGPVPSGEPIPIGRSP